MQIAEKARQAIFSHARRQAALTPPRESAGVMIDGEYSPLTNHAADPQQAFMIKPSDWGDKAVTAIVHSHPGGPPCPSHHDMQQQVLTGLPWIIVSTPTVEHACLEDIFVLGEPPRLDPEAGYRHGVHDCYSLIRAYYAEHMGVMLDDIPRGWGWWHEGRDHYLTHYEAMGFRPLDGGETPRPGDVFLARIRAPVINHGGIWLGDGLILHHLAGRKPHDPTRLPRKEPCARWYPFIEIWLRYCPRK